MRKTKIVCTIGPATDNEAVMRELMISGMNVARFNFSHGDYETHKKRFEMVNKLRNELGMPIATLMDTKGPEIRLGRFTDDKPVEIFDGDTYVLTTNDVTCTNKIGSISFKNLPKDVGIGTKILINDGVIELVAEKVSGTDITCRIIHGGILSNNKGINVPGVKLSMPYLSDADMNDLEFASKMGYDFIAASFVRTSADINYLRKFTQSLGWFDVRIIAKIENLDGVENIDEILDAADGIMVARGDMGVEIPFEQIPAIQKTLIHKGYNSGKQVITATQMLESMITNPRPTRAEITDVANAIYDGTSAIMLSGETAADRTLCTRRKCAPARFSCKACRIRTDGRCRPCPGIPCGYGSRPRRTSRCTRADRPRPACRSCAERSAPCVRWTRWRRPHACSHDRRRTLQRPHTAAEVCR